MAVRVAREGNSRREGGDAEGNLRGVVAALKVAVLAERERIRLELLAEAQTHGDEAARLADTDNAHCYHRTSKLALREFARRLEAA